MKLDKYKAIQFYYVSTFVQDVQTIIDRLNDEELASDFMDENVEYRRSAVLDTIRYIEHLDELCTRVRHDIMVKLLYPEFDD